jgi:hypothetical protein
LELHALFRSDFSVRDDVVGPHEDKKLSGDCFD